MKTSMVLCGLAIGCGLVAVGRAQERPGAAKPPVSLVTVVGCANRASDGTWQLTRATAGTAVKQAYSSTKEIEEAKKAALGTNRYKLVGTAEFSTKDELLKTQQRGEFTRPEVANATGVLQDGRKVVVKGLLITTSSDKTLNLMSVQKVDDTCK